METGVMRWSGILVYVECQQGVLHPVTAELIGEAYRLSKMSGEKVYGVAIGTGLSVVRQKLQEFPIEKTFLYETVDEYDPILYEKIFADCIRKVKPSVVFVGGTMEGRALAPRLAVAFGSGLTADCTEFSYDDEGNLIQTRPAFGGNLMASIVTKYHRPQFATVRPHVMKPVACTLDKTGSFEGVKWDGNIQWKKIERIEERKEPDGIQNQQILVVAGRGVKKKEDLEMLRELAVLLGGKLASSRALVEKGYMLSKDQIGLSGHTVTPHTILTCGVSGTVQFMAGMKQSKNIIAINNDPEARIFDIAHYPICGDLYEIIPELIQRLKKQCSNKGDGSIENSV